MTRRAYLYFVITFVIGLALGAIGFYTYAWNTGHWRRPWSENGAIHSLTRQLDLTTAQSGQLRSILDGAIKSHHAIEEQQRPAFEALHQQTDQRIRQILNPDQAKRFDEMLARRRKARETRRK